MTFGEKLQLLRKQNNLSQEQLAAQLNVSRQAISKWESNSSLPDMANMVLLSKIFHVSTDYFLKENAETEAMENEAEDLKQRMGKYIEAAKNHIPEVIVCTVVMIAILAAFIICFVQNAHMRRELRTLEERISSIGSSIVWNNDSEETESLLASIEVSYISDVKEDVHSGTATYLCSVIPKEFKQDETSVVLICEGKEYPTTFENGKYVAELTVPFYEGGSLTEIQMRENGAVRTEKVYESFEPGMQLPQITVEYNGKRSKKTKADKILWKHKGEFQIYLAGLDIPVESIEMITCIDGKEQKRTEVPQKNIPQMQWNTDHEIPNSELFYYAINEEFEVPIGSQFDLYMEVVDTNGLRYCKRAGHAHIDEHGKFVDDFWPEEELEGIYNKDGKRVGVIL